MSAIPSSPPQGKSSSSVKTVSPQPARSRRSMALKLDQTTADSRRQAAAILEVLAGVRTPTDAAKALTLSVPAYYKLESRALLSMVNGCQAPPRGRGPSPEAEANKLRKQCHRLQQDLQRYQALARNAQRAVGLGPVVPVPKTDALGRRNRKPSVRALRVIQSLRSVPEPATAPAAALSVASNDG